MPSAMHVAQSLTALVITYWGATKAQNLRTKRHNALCDVLFNALLVGDSRCRRYIAREMRCDSTSEARPGDIFHPDFERGLPTYTLTLL